MTSLVVERDLKDIFHAYMSTVHHNAIDIIEKYISMNDMMQKTLSRDLRISITHKI